MKTGNPLALGAAAFALAACVGGVGHPTQDGAAAGDGPPAQDRATGDQGGGGGGSGGVGGAGGVGGGGAGGSGGRGDASIDGARDAPGACSPSNYTKITNTAPMPADFCAYSYFPFRARMPDKPQHNDAANTKILQNQYAPNSNPSNIFSSQLETLGVNPDGPGQGDTKYPIYKASSSDPLISMDCSKADYGCSDANGNKITSIPPFRIPAWARSSLQFTASNSADKLIGIIQPDGMVVDMCLNGN